jgi:hypothetical protein
VRANETKHTSPSQHGRAPLKPPSSRPCLPEGRVGLGRKLPPPLEREGKKRKRTVSAKGGEAKVERRTRYPSALTSPAKEKLDLPSVRLHSPEGAAFLTRWTDGTHFWGGFNSVAVVTREEREGGTRFGRWKRARMGRRGRARMGYEGERVVRKSGLFPARLDQPDEGRTSSTGSGRRGWKESLRGGSDE